MKKIIAIALVLVIALGMAACKETGNKTITVAASSTPHAEILEVAKQVLADKGWKLEIVTYDDYVTPNTLVDKGELDANYFQHLPYMETFNGENGTALVSVAAIHCEPMGLYPGTKSTVEEMLEGDRIAIPNDGSNRARALMLLQSHGLIDLADDVNMTATVLDIVENPLNRESVEMPAHELVDARDDVAMVVINGNYALAAGLNVQQDAIAVEGATARGYANILVVKDGNEDTPQIQALKEALTSPEVRNFINQNYGGAVIPLF